MGHRCECVCEKESCVCWNWITLIYNYVLCHNIAACGLYTHAHTQSNPRTFNYFIFIVSMFRHSLTTVGVAFVLKSVSVIFDVPDSFPSPSSWCVCISSSTSYIFMLCFLSWFDLWDLKTKHPLGLFLKSQGPSWGPEDFVAMVMRNSLPVCLGDSWRNLVTSLHRPSVGRIHFLA